MITQKYFWQVMKGFVIKFLHERYYEITKVSDLTCVCRIKGERITAIKSTRSVLLDITALNKKLFSVNKAVREANYLCIAAASLIT